MPTTHVCLIIDAFYPAGNLLMLPRERKFMIATRE